MPSILANRRFRHLFAAQVLSLLGAGLATFALALLAYDLAGADAGAVLGTALAIKMLAYVFVSPLAGALASRFPRRSFLITLDVCRASMVMLLPFVTATWQIYVLVFLFQSFSAAFTPAFQATIPDILKDERDYTRALSLSRLAYDMESLLSPALAALLLTVVSFQWLFFGTTLGFVLSALLVLSVSLPVTLKSTLTDDSFRNRLTRGMRIYQATPRLRGLLALCLAVAAASAMVIVNTVVLVRDTLGGSEQSVALFFMAYGGGSMLVALLLPRLLDTLPDRRVMLSGAVMVTVSLAAAVTTSSFIASLVLWFCFGIGNALVQTPAGRLLARSAHPEDRPAVYAAHFALSHACWLLTYPLAGWLGVWLGLPITFVIMAALAAVAAALATRLWPDEPSQALDHQHVAMHHTHWHVHDEHHSHDHEGWEGPEPHAHPHSHAPLRHRHVYKIDDHHQYWPTMR